MIQFPIYPQESIMLILVASGMVSCDGKWESLIFTFGLIQIITMLINYRVLST